MRTGNGCLNKVVGTLVFRVIEDGALGASLPDPFRQDVTGAGTKRNGVQVLGKHRQGNGARNREKVWGLHYQGNGGFCFPGHLLRQPGQGQCLLTSGLGIGLEV